jgi:hypothetical protein
LPNAKSVSLVVSWFGNDLRAGECELKPGVDTAAKTTSPITWSVAGLARADAHLVSLKDGRPAYGGTPSDQTVIAAIQDLNARGFHVTLTPFILGRAGGQCAARPLQPATRAFLSSRGRITVDRAGQPGSPDKTAAVHRESRRSWGLRLSDFPISEARLSTRDPRWSLRRIVA